MTTHVDECTRFCIVVARHPDITNATARIGAWLFGVLSSMEVSSIELTYRDIRDGINYDNGVAIPGTGSHIDTVKKSIDWLEEKGVIKTAVGRPSGFGHYSRIYSLTI